MRCPKRGPADGPRAVDRLRHIGCWAVLLLTAACAQNGETSSEFLPIIDAHSQIAAYHDPDAVIRLLEQGKISRVILSWRFPWASSARPNPDPILKLAAKYPDLIVPAIGTKGPEYLNNSRTWRVRTLELAKDERFKAMAELHIYHEAKRNAPRVFVMPSDPRILVALDVAKERGWPLILHIEFPNLKNAQRPRVLSELKDLMRKNSGQPFVLIHMALLEADEVEALIRDHPNVYFITSRTNRVTLPARSTANFISIFEGGTRPILEPKWRKLIVEHPDRFVLGFDNVDRMDWTNRYLEQIALWREALSKLHRDVAEAVAHRNAERLWHLAPVQ